MTLIGLLWLASLHDCGFGRGPCCWAPDGCIEDYDGYHWPPYAFVSLAKECL